MILELVIVAACLIGGMGLALALGMRGLSSVVWGSALGILGPVCLGALALVRHLRPHLPRSSGHGSRSAWWSGRGRP